MPLGVVAGIVPFNFPAMIPWGWMVPLAIATGNTVVLKAASQTPLTSMRIMELFYDEGGFPKGVVNLVTCSRGESEVLLTDPRIKAVTFVGTTEVGKHIYSIAAAHRLSARPRITRSCSRTAIWRARSTPSSTPPTAAPVCAAWPCR